MLYIFAGKEIQKIQRKEILMLAVKSLGKFEVTDGVNVLNDEVLRSDMLKKLLIYMLTHRGHSTTNMELIEALWQDDEVEKPIGALKNLMYRLRNALKTAFGDYKYIITSQGAYAWNTDIKVSLDIEQFEAYCKAAKEAKGNTDIVKNLENAIYFYSGEFMENTMDQHWAIALSTYYHSLFINAVKELAQLYIDEERYQEVENTCIYALKVDRADEDIYCYYITALIHENKYELAMKQYEEANQIMYDAYGLNNSPKLQKIHEEILKMNKGNEVDLLEDIHEDMAEEEFVGVYFCGYPVFREIYRLEVRKNVRLGIAEYIVLLTVEVDPAIRMDNKKMAQFLLNQGMNNLKKTLEKVLRIGDVAAQYSDSQFIILLPTCTYEGSLGVVKRIINYFSKLDKGKKVKIRTEFEQLSDVNSELVR